MTLPLKLICSKNKLRKNGTSLIFIQYCFTSEERTLLNTGIAIPPNYWNRKQGRVSRDLPLKFGEVEKHEVKLNELLRRAEDIVNYALKGNRGSPVNFLKSNFHLNEVSYKISENKPKINLDVFYNIDLYIECKRSSVKHCTINVISAMKNT